MKSDGAFKVALGGMMAALSLILMLLTRVIPFSEMALPAVAGVLLIAAVLEVGAAWSFAIFAAVGLLSLFFAFQNGAAFYYVLFFGPYPIVKSYIERLKSRPVQWTVKILLFNICALLLYLASAKIFGVPDALIKYGWALSALVVNATFVIYDIALSRLVVLYVYRIRKRLKKP